MNRFGEQPNQNFRQDPSMQQDYPEDNRGFQQTQEFPENRMPAPQPCEKTEEKKSFFDKFKFWGGKRKRTKRKRSKRRKSRRS
jgi:hypothetical protein